MRDDYVRYALEFIYTDDNLNFTLWQSLPVEWVPDPENGEHVITAALRGGDVTPGEVRSADEIRVVYFDGHDAYEVAQEYGYDDTPIYVRNNRF